MAFTKGKTKRECCYFWVDRCYRPNRPNRPNGPNGLNRLNRFNLMDEGFGGDLPQPTLRGSTLSLWRLFPYLWAGICVWVCYLNERVVCEALFFGVGNLVGLGNCCKFVAQILITSMGDLHLYHHHHCCFLTESWVPVCGGM